MLRALVPSIDAQNELVVIQSKIQKDKDTNQVMHVDLKCLRLFLKEYIAIIKKC
jgi:hypothetical protein